MITASMVASFAERSSACVKRGSILRRGRRAVVVARFVRFLLTVKPYTHSAGEAIRGALQQGERLIRLDHPRAMTEAGLTSDRVA